MKIKPIKIKREIKIRSPIIPSQEFKDKSKYSRKQKHKRKYHD